jgi:hypothetical protein
VCLQESQRNREGFERNGTHLLLVCANDVSVIGENTNTVNLHTETLLGTSKEVGLHVVLGVDGKIILE